MLRVEAYTLHIHSSLKNNAHLIIYVCTETLDWFSNMGNKTSGAFENGGLGNLREICIKLI